MEPTRNLESPELSDQFSYFGFHVFPLFLDITEILCSFDESVHVPEALISEKAAGLLGQLEKAWAGGPGKPGSGKAVKVKFESRRNKERNLLQVNYLCGQLTPDLFLHRGASLLMAGLMDYYTVPVWTEQLVSEILDFPSCANCFDNDEEGRMLVCSR